jgi:phosphopantothenoylcysteine decarboxylase/phosphopantothenate--cysteine ligase
MDVEPPAGAVVVRVDTAAELRSAMLEQAEGADVVVMAAAVADFRPAAPGEHKLKRGETGPDLSLPLAQNPDILHELVERRGDAGRPVIVGFAAETGDAERDVLTLGREKLARKGCDLLVVNDVGAGRVFGQPDNEVVILGADGAQVDVPRTDKATVADAVWDEVVRTLS